MLEAEVQRNKIPSAQPSMHVLNGMKTTVNKMLVTKHRDQMNRTLQMK